ncbi:hypothetical protein HaLaN_08729 [Haematococcus lacustris]|uniref:Uncharacterized protein n=1 Tax=Haematococcus lacustris TaxID=44745 RepID=A0A699YUM4_HAELA|nr:hypothetical protein HaLaN_08729 [Haematococcus lacustris]
MAEARSSLDPAGLGTCAQGLDTDYPTLKFPQGPVLKGIYGPTLGTTMVFATTPGQGYRASSEAGHSQSCTERDHSHMNRLKPAAF